MALATLADLKTYMDISLTNVQEDATTLVLAGLQSELETYLRRPIETGVLTETHVVPSDIAPFRDTAYFYDDSLNTTLTSEHMLASPVYMMYVDNSPIVTVTSLTRQGPTDASPTTLTEGTDFIVRSFALDVPAAAADDKLVITYTAGIDGTTIPYFKLLILRAASREIQNLHDDSVGLKDLETRNVAVAQIGFTEAELASVSRYRRRRI